MQLEPANAALIVVDMQNSFCKPGASTVGSWRALERSWGFWEHDTGGPGFDSLGFDWISGTFKGLFGHFGFQDVCFFMLVSKLFFLMDLVSESACLWLVEHAIGIRSIVKTNFRITWNAHDIRVHFG